MTKIIGISGISGAGKSALVSELSKQLKAPAIHWDEFDDISTGPEDYVDWYDRGKNYTEWDYPSLAEVLAALRSGQSIKHPVFDIPLKPSKYVVFDAPLGRLHEQTGKYIDLWVHVDVPLDIALARRLLRDYKDPNKSKDKLLEDLEYYLHHSRNLFLDADLKSSDDFVVDGSLSTAQQCDQVLMLSLKAG